MGIRSTKNRLDGKSSLLIATKRTGGGTNPRIPGITSGSFLYYDGGTYSGTTWTDLSGNSNNGTLTNGPTYNSNNGGYFDFDGTNDEVTTATSFTNPNSYTVTAWFKTSTNFSGGGKKIIGFENNQTGTGTSGWDRMIYVGSDNKLYFGHYDGSVRVASSTITVNDGVWRHAAMTYGGESTTMRLYLNGVSNATKAANGPQNYTGWWRIGAYKASSWTNGSDGYFTGSIGQVIVYHKALTATEISDNYEVTRQRFGV